MTPDQVTLVFTLSAVCLAIVALSGVVALIHNYQDRAREEREWTERLIYSGLTKGTRKLTPDEIDTYRRDGVVCLRQVLPPEWVEITTAAIAAGVTRKP